ncbi:Cyclin, N-terminal domain containing protein [Tritrichomonas foetus]|uniref:Cyclin n=1 Tax=Tritrichomonas foetus TaxID=1144522 RepID=A0A1J4JQQ2_9EUKA|nr:Cyclin, N-terminal domain containing protein [Tritrichomonas foetus]|eukprot:OHT01082.1 Cyclin, N-terminal domain containing protein [Tritrichomonas foetus]
MEKNLEDDTEAVLRVISFTLQEAATQNELLSGPNVTLTRFHTLSPPKISIINYIQFLHTKTHCARSCFVIAMILLDRLLRLQSHIQVTPNTVHKLFLCSLMTASKFNTDLNMSNTAWAAVGGIRPEEMNILELEFLFLLQFSINVTKDEFTLYNEELSEKAKLSPFTNYHCNNANA